MTFRPTWSLLPLASVVALAGCPSETVTPDAARAPDAFMALDAFTAEDAFASPDAVEFDAGTDAAAPSDAGRDAPFARPDALMVDGGLDCMYVPVDEVVVKCGTAYRFVNQFQSERRDCPTFHGFTLEGPRYATAAEAIASDASCDASCIYDFAMSVSRVYCGRRTGYETLTAVGCADLYRFTEGYYDSVESHDAMHPCPPMP